MSSNPHVCASCGQTTAYRSAMSRGIVITLQTIREYIEEKGVNAVHLEKELVQTGRLTGNQKGNAAAHMVRLGLLAHLDEPGNFCLTERAMRFLAGMPIPREAFVAKRTEHKGSHTIETSEETCTIKDFRKDGDYWTVPGFEIRSGRVMQGDTPKDKLPQAGMPEPKIAVDLQGTVRFVLERDLDRFLAYYPDARVI